MIEYIYFVKCPNCEDEHFSFFDEAKDFALGCLSQKPIITQVEVDRNDFGECTDSCDRGTVWSWEDMMKDTEPEPVASVFTKDDLVEFDPETDPEFTSLSNSLDDIPDNFRRPVPADMTIEGLVEEMEENEDTVECKWCNELFDKSECRFEVDMGYLCDRCEQAIKSRGEILTFREGCCNKESGNLSEAHFSGSDDQVEFEYDDLEVTLQGQKRDVDDWDDADVIVEYTYEVDADDVATDLWDNFLTEEDVASVPGGFNTLENDDAAWAKFLDDNFEALCEKYYDQLLDFYRDYATKEYEENHSLEDYYSDNEPEYDRSDYYAEGCNQKKSMLEELEDADTYRDRLSLCPECGATTFDIDTGFCITCGFN